MFEDLFCDALKAWSSIHSIKLDSKVFLRTPWVMACWENDSSEAIALTIILVELSDHCANCWRGEQAVLTDVHLSHAICKSNLDDLLSGHVIIVSTISWDYHGFAKILTSWKSKENWLDEVFKVEFLRENLYFFSKTTGSWFLVIVCFCHCNLDFHQWWLALVETTTRTVQVAWLLNNSYNRLIWKSFNFWKLVFSSCFNIHFLIILQSW